MSRFRVAIVDYGAGNIHSVASAIRRLGYGVQLAAARDALESADAIVLPGVGAFGPAIGRLRDRGLDAAIWDAVARGRPLLGICLGMQLLADSSEEDGEHTGLGLVPGRVVHLRATEGIRVPHVGWQDVRVRIDAPLFRRTPSGSHFFFDHSFHFECADDVRAAVCEYGTEVTAAVQRGNVFGVQFHPEKSQTSGLRLLRSFFVAMGAAEC